MKGTNSSRNRTARAGRPKMPATQRKERTKAMLEFTGIRMDGPKADDIGQYIRELRSGDRLERLPRQ